VTNKYTFKFHNPTLLSALSHAHFEDFTSCLFQLLFLNSSGDCQVESIKSRPLSCSHTGIRFNSPAIRIQNLQSVSNSMKIAGQDDKNTKMEQRTVNFGTLRGQQGKQKLPFISARKRFSKWFTLYSVCTRQYLKSKLLCFLIKDIKGMY
jgi:hypothetical protein